MHDVAAAHRLDVAGHVGDDRDVRSSARAVCADLDRRRGSGRRSCASMPSWMIVDPVPDIGREGVALDSGSARRPRRPRRAPSCIAFLTRSRQIISSLRTGNSGSKSDVLALRRVIVFEIGDMARLRPDILQEQVLAPAGVHHDEIRLEALLRQGAGLDGDAIGALQGREDGREAAVEGVAVRPRHRRIGIIGDARHRAGLDRPQRHHLVSLGREDRRQAARTGPGNSGERKRSSSAAGPSTT